MKNLKTHHKALLLAAVISLAAWAFPPLATLLLPLTYLNTILHETCHAIAGSVTGAMIDRIVIHADGSGVTPMTGGNIWLIGPAGYMGSTIIGTLIIWFSRTEKSAIVTLRALTFLLLVSTLMWVRADAIGVVAAFGWLIALGLGSVFLKGNVAIFVAQFIGLQQCLNSVTSVYMLMNISAAAPETHSDAMIMQQNTGIPAFLWAAGWCLFSLALVAVSLRRSWIDPMQPKTRRSGPKNPIDLGG